MDIAVADVGSGVTMAALLTLGAGILGLAAWAVVSLVDYRSPEEQKPDITERK